MKSRLKITGYVVCLLSVFLLEGYISLYTGRYTVIDLGGAIDNIGKQTPHLQEEACRETLGDTQIATSDYHYQVWEKDDMFYVQLPLAYLPADETVFLHRSGYGEKNTLACTWPNVVTQEKIQAAPLEHFIAILSKEQYEDACEWCKFDLSLFGKKLAGKSHRVYPMNEVDMTGAKKIVDLHPATAYDKRPQLCRVAKEAPTRRTWYNYCLMPLSWAAEVVDIPLTIIATPIGWLVDAIYEPLHN
jgi:hypothetical protein